ncbi:hypothetical protein [Oceaniglobus trochenteri]|uniref:hypothetical protein n=1 Tax=Oceaniglobus trochenteri TaxID=2763260 RepID=UPI001CFF7448|nr:hypothetical protein [Oceaniglobus trochenteri]
MRLVAHLWWRSCGRYWALRYLRALGRADTIPQYTRAARLRQRSEACFARADRIKGARA